jgi:DNA-binding SARP family transcriptional activator
MANKSVNADQPPIGGGPDSVAGSGTRAGASLGPGAEGAHNLHRARMALQAFDGHPYALLIVDEDGVALSHNEAAREIFAPAGHAADDLERYMIDEVLARVDQQIGGDRTVLARALESGVPLPEVRIDLPAGAAVQAAWVTIAPLDGGDRAIIELRPGRLSDRRRRTQPYWARGPQLRIQALGRTRVESEEATIGGRWLEHRTGQLLKYLVVERHRAVHADEIVERLWPESGARGLQSVRYFIYRLREQLEPERAPRSGSSFIGYSEGAYYIDREHVHIDADEFEAAVKAGRTARDAGDLAAAGVHFERATKLYAGDFLAEEAYAEWAMTERTRLRLLAAHAFEALATMSEAEGDLEGAAEHLVRLCELDPFDVDIHRRYISLCLHRGRRTEALRRYGALRGRLMTTFGEELDFTLGDLPRA